MVMIIIRLAKDSEVLNLVKASSDIFKENKKYDLDFDDEWYKKTDAKNYFSDFIKHPDNLLNVAIDGDQIVGYVSVSPKVFDDRKTKKVIEVVDLGVISGYRNLGIGKLLLQSVVDWAKEHSYTRLYLNCYFKNKKALRFYETLGFNVIDVNLEKEI